MIVGVTEDGMAAKWFSRKMTRRVQTHFMSDSIDRVRKTANIDRKYVLMLAPPPSHV